MKVDYSSDFHLDFWIREKNPSSKLDRLLRAFADDIKLGTSGAEVLILAGDLGHYFIQDSTFLKLTKTFYKHVLLVHGNHDRYLVSNSIKEKYEYQSTNRINEMKEFCASIDVDYLDGNTVEINGVRFGGVGMSWDKSFLENLKGPHTDEEVQRIFNKTMNDSRLIYEGKPKASLLRNESALDPLAMFKQKTTNAFDPFDLFKQESAKLRALEDIDVVITHYPPSVPPDMSYEYRNSDVSTFFYFDGSKEIERLKAKFWVYGHTHTKANYTVHDTNMLCNPLGYPNENAYTTVQTFEV